MAKSVVELPFHRSLPAMEIKADDDMKPATNLEESEAQIEKVQVETVEAPAEPKPSFCLNIPQTATDFFPSSIVLPRPATAIPELRPPQAEMKAASLEAELPRVGEESDKSYSQIPEISEEEVFREFSGVSPSTPSRSFSPSPSPSLVPEPLNFTHDSERTLSMNSIQPSIFHVHRRTPTIESEPDSLTSDSSAASESSTPPPSTPISTAPTSPSPTFIMPSSPIMETPTFTAPQPKTPEPEHRPAAALRRSPAKLYVSTGAAQPLAELRIAEPQIAAPTPAAAPAARAPRRAIAPTPPSPLVLTLTSKYPTGAAAALYVPEDVSLPPGVRPTRRGRLRAVPALANLRGGAPKADKKSGAASQPAAVPKKMAAAASAPKSDKSGGASVPRAVPKKSAAAAVAPAPKPEKKSGRASVSDAMPKKTAAAATAAPAPTPVRPLQRPSASKILAARTATGLSALGKVSSEVGRAGSELVKSNGSVLRKRPQSISSAFYY